MACAVLTAVAAESATYSTRSLASVTRSMAVGASLRESAAVAAADVAALSGTGSSPLFLDVAGADAMAALRAALELSGWDEGAPAGVICADRAQPITKIQHK